jgi:hypothetical protein
MRRIVGALLLLGLAGCASFTAGRLQGSGHYPATDPAAVKILTAMPAGGGCVVIGDVEAQGGSLSSVDDMEASLKAKAAALGGDAVVLHVKERWHGITSDGDKSDATYIYNLEDMVTKKITGTVIRFVR